MLISSIDSFLQKYEANETGTALVTGSKVYKTRIDRRKLYMNAIGVDMFAGDGVDIVQDLELPMEGSYSHIDCVSVLEHSVRPWVVAKNLEEVLIPGGTFLISVPWVWRLHAYPDDNWRMSIPAVKSIFPNIVWDEIVYFANGRVSKNQQRVSVYKNTDGSQWIERTEVYGFGHKV